MALHPSPARDWRASRPHLPQTARRLLAATRIGTRAAADAVAAMGSHGTFFVVEPDREDLTKIATIVDEGSLRPTVGRCSTLSDGPELIGAKETGHVQGKVYGRDDHADQSGAPRVPRSMHGETRAPVTRPARRQFEAGRRAGVSRDQVRSFWEVPPRNNRRQALKGTQTVTVAVDSRLLAPPAENQRVARGPRAARSSRARRSGSTAC
jgi:hypothetical protein